MAAGARQVVTPGPAVGRTTGDQLIFDERMAVLRRLLEEHGPWPLDEARVLDVGCGHGHDLARLREWGARDANLHGVDLSRDRIDVARSCHPGMTFTCGSASALEYPDGFFDLVLMCTVMTSVLDESVARGIAREVGRVLRPGGAVLWYDFRYPSPTNRRTRPITRSQVEGYFPGYEGHGGSLTLLPPLARRLGALTRALYPILRAVPLLRSHHMLLLRKP